MCLQMRLSLLFFNSSLFLRMRKETSSTLTTILIHSIRATKRKKNRIPGDTMKLQACMAHHHISFVSKRHKSLQCNDSIGLRFLLLFLKAVKPHSNLYITGPYFWHLSLLRDGRCQQKILPQNIYPPNKANSLGKSWGKKSWYFFTPNSCCFMFCVLLNPPNTSTWQGPYNPIHQELKCHP